MDERAVHALTEARLNLEDLATFAKESLKRVDAWCNEAALDLRNRRLRDAGACG